MASNDKINSIVVENLAEARISTLKATNKLGQPTWVIINRSDGELINLHFDKIDIRKRNWAQQLILHEFPYQDVRGTLRYPHGTMKNRLNGIKTLIVYLDNQPDDKRQLKNWSVIDLVTFIQSNAVKGNKLASNASIRIILDALKTSYAKRYEQDGLSFTVPSNFLVDVMLPLCKRFDLTYSQWERGGSHGMVPMSVATLLLADAIKLIRGTKSQLLQCYYTEFRQGRLSRSMIDTGLSRKSVFNLNISNFIKVSKKNPITGVNTNVKNDTKRLAFVNKLHKVEPNLTDFPFKSHVEINDCAIELQGACITILLSVTLMRISECHSVGADWMDSIKYLDVNGEWTNDAILKSKIIKTSGGIVAKRGLSPLGVEVIELLNKLSWVDKEALGLQLLSPTYNSSWVKKNASDKTHNSLTIGTLRKRLQSYYQKFVARSHHSIKEVFPQIIPHNLRHLKMAFGLRKFDGDVEAAIKQEMRHHGHHTQAYSINKLNEEEVAHVKRDYVQEIIKRILINDPGDKWVGPAVKKVRKVAKNLLHGQNIEMLSMLEIAEFHEEFYEKIHSMMFHSYGFCFVMKDMIKVSKCGVKDNMVRTGLANSKLCHGCANFGIHNKSHEHNMLANKARWQDTVDCKTIARFPIVVEAQAIVRNIEKLEAELETSDE